MISKYDTLFVRAQSRLPKFNVKFKDESRLMRILGFFLFFNKEFMTDYTTTIGYTVYFPSRTWLAQEATMGWDWQGLAHEYVHAWDWHRLGGLRFVAAYLFPQCLSVLALLAFGAFWSPYMLLTLTALVFLAPLPAPGRTYLEARGYAMNAMIDAYVLKPSVTVSVAILRYAPLLSGDGYYGACDESHAIGAINDALKANANGPHSDLTVPYDDVLQIP